MEIYTIKDVAREAGVAVSTVSRVLNGRPDVSEQTRRRVMDVVEACGFVQNRNARELKRVGNRFAAIIVRGRRNAFLSDAAEQMITCAQQTDTPFLLRFIDETEDEFGLMRRLYAERSACGFILLGACLDERAQVLQAMNTPCVLATVDARRSGLDRVSSVSIDDRAAARAMMDRLLDAGHRRIAIFGGDPEGSDAFSSRYRGALDSLRARGVDFDPVRCYVRMRFSMQSAYEGTMRFFSHNPGVTAVMTMSDSMALGVIRALRDMGRSVPQALSVTGFDGTEAARFSIPSLATVRQPSEQIAQESVRLLCAGLTGTAPEHVTVGYQMVKGESIGPAAP